MAAALCVPSVLAEQGAHRSQAVQMYNRIAGMPPSKEVIAKMSELIRQGKPIEAGYIATESYGFYNIKLRRMFSSWSNVGGNADVDLNDMVATMIGMVKDNIPFNQVLSGDFIYIGEGESGSVQIPPYSLANNSHYQALQNLDLRLLLKKHPQTDITQLPEEAQAGVISTRAFAESYFSAGTNRRATAFTLKHFLCHEMESLHDTSFPDRKVRHDVNRTPGGDKEVYNNRCKGCHAAMDAISDWSVYYDFNNQLVYTAGSVVAKINDPNATQFDTGHYPADDSFENLWASKEDDKIGWKTKQGKGAKDYGNMLTATDAFASCMASQVWSQVCLTDPENNAAARDVLAEKFAKHQYNLKQLFAATASRCLTW